MKLEDTQNKTTTGLVRTINIKLIEERFRWMKRNDVSATLLFNKALDEIGCPK